MNLQSQATFQTNLQGSSRSHLVLVHTMLMQPRTVLLVRSLNVVNEPAVQEDEQFAYIHGLAALQPGDGLLELPQQTLVLVAVAGQAREAMLLHQLLLTPEV